MSLHAATSNRCFQADSSRWVQLRFVGEIQRAIGPSRTIASYHTLHLEFDQNRQAKLRLAPRSGGLRSSERSLVRLKARSAHPPSRPPPSPPQQEQANPPGRGPGVLTLQGCGAPSTSGATPAT